MALTTFAKPGDDCLNLAALTRRLSLVACPAPETKALTQATTAPSTTGGKSPIGIVRAGFHASIAEDAATATVAAYAATGGASMSSKTVRMVRVQMDDEKWAEIRQYGIRRRKNLHTLLGQMLEREIDRLLREERKAKPV